MIECFVSQVCYNNKVRTLKRSNLVSNKCFASSGNSANHLLLPICFLLEDLGKQMTCEVGHLLGEVVRPFIKRYI